MRIRVSIDGARLFCWFVGSETHHCQPVPIDSILLAQAPVCGCEETEDEDQAGEEDNVDDVCAGCADCVDEH